MRHRVNGRWPCKRTALVLRDGQVGGGTRAHAGAIRCSAWLQATWTQPVDIVRWDALLRSEVEAYSVVVLEAGVVPQERCEAVLVALRGVAGRRIFEVANPTLVAAASAPDSLADGVWQIGRAPDRTSVTNAHLECRHLPEKK